jgi:hypothetical protein
MKVPHTLRKTIRSLQTRVRQSQHDSAWTGSTTPHARRMQRRLARVTSLAKRFARL